MSHEIGVSTGSLFKFLNGEQTLKFLKSLGLSAVEISILRFDGKKDGWIVDITQKDLESFNYVSLHAPKHEYCRNKKTLAIFNVIENLNKIRPLDLVVFHPDLVKDFTVFDDVNFPIAFENMDNRKFSFKTPDEMRELIGRNEKYNMVLDINHVFVNDQSMVSAGIFYNLLRERIKEIHLSGCDTNQKDFYHDPLFKTRNNEIIDAVKGKTTPIIIESVMSPEEVEKEINYVREILKG